MKETYCRAGLMTALQVAMSGSFCLPHHVAMSAFIICSGLCVLYVSFGSKVRTRSFGYVAMGTAVLFILRSRLLLYSAGSGVKQSASCFVWI